MANEMNLSEPSEIQVPEKKKKKHRRFPLKVSLFIAIVLPVILIPSILLGSKWMKNRIVSEIDEKLQIRRTKCITFVNWKNLMMEAKTEEVEKNPEDYEEPEEMPEYIVYPGSMTDSYMSSEENSRDFPHFSMDELRYIDSSRINRIAGGIITDPDGDRAYMLGDSPIIEYGGLTYKLSQGYDSEKKEIVDICLGLNQESEANASLAEAGTEIAQRILVKQDENPWQSYSEIGWCGDYRYISFTVVEKSTWLTPILSFPNEIFSYSEDPVTGDVSIEPYGNGTYSVSFDSADIQAAGPFLSEETYLTTSDSGFLFQSQSRTPMILFVDAAPQLKTLKNQVRRVSVYAAVAYVLILAGAVAIELRKSKIPEWEEAGSDGHKEEDDHIPDQVAKVLLSKITDVEQSMGPNGYLDQLRDEIDSRRASREKPEEDS